LNRVDIQPQARADAEEAAVWYEAQRPGLGIEFILELDAAIERAAESPAVYARQHAEVRRVLLRRFPYAVYFVYQGQVLEILAVLHQHRSPRLWRTRLG
jgi:plasmid stabilization system protein ParE